ncbi:MAG: hydroxyacylglutathione hydrolase GloC [Myxococcota bacterium]
MRKNLIIEWRVVSAFMENAYLIADKETKEGYFIDPGDDAETLIALAEKLSVKPLAILNTHGHIDHIAAVADLKKHYGIKFFLHKEDEVWLENVNVQARLFGVPKVEKPAVDDFLRDGDEFKMGEFTIKTIHTPGHSAGGVCFYIQSADVLITGDTLFEGSIGRTDFPGGNYEQLIATIKNKILTLPENTEVYSGHGGVTTVGKEKLYNPFLQ